MYIRLILSSACAFWFACLLVSCTVFQWNPFYRRTLFSYVLSFTALLFLFAPCFVVVLVIVKICCLPLWLWRLFFLNSFRTGSELDIFGDIVHCCRYFSISEHLILENFLFFYLDRSFSMRTLKRNTYGLICSFSLDLFVHTTMRKDTSSSSVDCSFLAFCPDDEYSCRGPLVTFCAMSKSVEVKGRWLQTFKFSVFPETGGRSLQTGLIRISVISDFSAVR